MKRGYATAANLVQQDLMSFERRWWTKPLGKGQEGEVPLNLSHIHRLSKAPHRPKHLRLAYPTEGRWRNVQETPGQRSGLRTTFIISAWNLSCFDNPATPQALPSLWKLGAHLHEKSSVFKDFANKTHWVEPCRPRLWQNGDGGVETLFEKARPRTDFVHTRNWVAFRCRLPLYLATPLESLYFTAVGTKLLCLDFWMGPKSKRRIVGEVLHSKVRFKQECPQCFIQNACR